MSAGEIVPVAGAVAHAYTSLVEGSGVFERYRDRRQLAAERNAVRDAIHVTTLAEINFEAADAVTTTSLRRLVAGKRAFDRALAEVGDDLWFAGELAGLEAERVEDHRRIRQHAKDRLRRQIQGR
jgi:hypothetical protein